MTVHYLLKEFSEVHHLDNIMSVSIDPEFIICNRPNGEIIKIKAKRIAYLRTDDFRVYPENVK